MHNYLKIQFHRGTLVVSVIFQMGMAQARDFSPLAVPAFTSRSPARAWSPLKSLEAATPRQEGRVADLFIKSLDLYRFKDIVKAKGLDGRVESASIELTLTVLVPDSRPFDAKKIFGFIAAPQDGVLDVAELRVGRFVPAWEARTVAPRYRSEQIRVTVPLQIPNGDISRFRMRLSLRNDLRGFRELQRAHEVADQFETTIYGDGLHFFGAGTFQGPLMRPRSGLQLGSLDSLRSLLDCERQVLGL